jgi:hypothetical protein
MRIRDKYKKEEPGELTHNPSGSKAILDFFFWLQRAQLRWPSLKEVGK